MDFDSYSNRLTDLTEHFNEFLTTDNKVKKLSKEGFRLPTNLYK